VVTPKTRLTSSSGKAIAIRMAEDGYDVCINDVAANQAGIDEVCPVLLAGRISR